MDPSVRERWNDYGIGLLLQGDLKGAEAAFLKVTRDGARLRRRLGQRRRARGSRKATSTAREADAARRRCSVDPELAKTHFFLGTALKSARALRRGARRICERAAAQYPRDRVVLNQIGRVLFLKRAVRRRRSTRSRQVLDDRSRGSAGALQPDALLQGLGDAKRAAREQALYLRFKADESSQAITGPYRQLHPDDNNERQPIHEHAIVPPPARRRSRRGRGCGAIASQRRRGDADRMRRCWRLARRRAVLRRSARRRRRSRAPAARRSPTSPPQPASASPTTAARSGRSTCPRRSGPGVAFLDADGDGWQDILFVNSTNWPGQPGPPSLSGALSQQPQRHVHRRHAAAASTSRCTASASPSADYDNDGDDRHLHHLRSAPTACSTTSAAASSPTSPRAAGVGDRGLLHQRRLVRLRPRRQARSVRRQLRRSGRSRRTCAARSTARRKSYCTPESYKGQSATLYHNRGDGTFEDVDAEGRRRTIRRQGARRRGARLQRRRLARPLRRQRHPAEQAVSQQGQRHVHRRRHDGRRRVQRGRRGARRHGRRRRRLRRLGPPEPDHRQLLERDDGALLTTRATACSSTRRRPRRSARRRC